MHGLRFARYEAGRPKQTAETHFLGLLSPLPNPLQHKGALVDVRKDPVTALRENAGQHNLHGEVHTEGARLRPLQDSGHPPQVSAQLLQGAERGQAGITIKLSLKARFPYGF